METFRTKLRQVDKALAEASVCCGHGYESVHDEAVALVLGAAHLAPNQSLDLLDQAYPSEANERLDALVRGRCEDRMPVAYLLGVAYLAGLSFLSDQRALVPRSPIAHLIEEGLIPWWRGTKPPSVIADVCCGGGSLGILAAKRFPEASVWLADLDPDALALASENIARHRLSGRVRCVQGDLLTHFGEQSVDLLIANPPYVSDREMSELPPEYRHEPRIALEAEAAGTELAVRMLGQARSVLSADGLLVLEVGETMVELEARLERVPFLWLDLPQGGSGIAAISAQELRDWHAAGIL